MLISGHDDNNIILWDMETRQPIGQPLSGHADSVFSVALSPDGKTLASGGYDSYIILWDIDPQLWIERTCRRVQRNFIQNQWIQYFPAEEYRKTCEKLPRHSSFYREAARKLLLDPEGNQQVEKALEGVRSKMEMDPPIRQPAVEAARIVEDVLMTTIFDEAENQSWKEILSLLHGADASHLSLDLLLQDDEFMKSVCWIGSLEGYAWQALEFCSRAADIDKGLNPDFTDYRNYARALASEPSLTTDLNVLWDICKNGGLDGYADRILEYCDRAIELSPDDPDLHDSRGMARAMTGNLKGAIEDFQFYVDGAIHLGYSETLIQERQKWILRLQEGVNPFTSEVINQLKDQ